MFSNKIMDEFDKGMNEINRNKKYHEITSQMVFTVIESCKTTSDSVTKQSDRIAKLSELLKVLLTVIEELEIRVTNLEKKNNK
jgi:hypothetical protein